MQKSRIRSSKQRAKSRNGKSGKPRQQLLDKISKGEAVNLELAKAQFKTEVARAQKQRKAKKDSEKMRTKDLLVQQAEKNLNVFNTKHMEIILQRNLRLNIKTKEASVQTDPDRLQYMIRGLASESSQTILQRSEKQFRLHGAKDLSLSLWLKKQIDKDLKLAAPLDVQEALTSGKLSRANLNHDITTGAKQDSASIAINTTTRSSPT